MDLFRKNIISLHFASQGLCLSAEIYLLLEVIQNTSEALSILVFEAVWNVGRSFVLQTVGMVLTRKLIVIFAIMHLK